MCWPQQSDDLTYSRHWRKFSYADLDNLPEPDEIAEEIIENLEAGLDSFRQVLSGLSSR
jgi:hypothetical protein